MPTTKRKRETEGETVPLLLTKGQAARLCGLGESTLDRYRGVGWFPQPLRVGNALRWRADELRSWVEAGCPRG